MTLVSGGDFPLAGSQQRGCRYLVMTLRSEVSCFWFQTDNLSLPHPFKASNLFGYSRGGKKIKIKETGIPSKLLLYGARKFEYFFFLKFKTTHNKKYWLTKISRSKLGLEATLRSLELLGWQERSASQETVWFTTVCVSHTFSLLYLVRGDER